MASSAILNFKLVSLKGEEKKKKKNEVNKFQCSKRKRGKLYKTTLGKPGSESEIILFFFLFSNSLFTLELQVWMKLSPELGKALDLGNVGLSAVREPSEQDRGTRGLPISLLINLILTISLDNQISV